MDAVLKIGGSLSDTPQTLRRLCGAINKISAHHKIMIVPGGGVFADLIRHVSKRYKSQPSTSHWMAIYGMDQYGYLLHELLEDATPCQTSEEVRLALANHQLPIFLPANYLRRFDELPHSWFVTSDSIAAYLAGKMGFNDLVVVTDVDGIFRSIPKKGKPNLLLPTISTETLKNLQGGGGRDIYFPYYLEHFGLSCAIINGRQPQRLEALFDGRPTVTTRIFLVEDELL